jgi:hypothetical protein
MGIYVNPPRGYGTKEEWLEKHKAKWIQAYEFCTYTPNYCGLIGVCLVDNGAFTALAVADSIEEAEAFCRLGDSRPKHFFLVPLEDLLKEDAGLDHQDVERLKKLQEPES